jgi:hypothetical protein
MPFAYPMLSRLTSAGFGRALNASSGRGPAERVSLKTRAVGSSHGLSHRAAASKNRSSSSIAW